MISILKAKLKITKLSYSIFSVKLTCTQGSNNYSPYKKQNYSRLLILCVTGNFIHYQELNSEINSNWKSDF